MKFPYKVIVKTEKDTKKAAEQFAEILNKENCNSKIVSFNGNLGSGKTTMIKYIASYFNIKNVTSPSFSIVNEYIGNKKIYHFDFYRLKNLEELYDIGFEDYLNDSEAIVLIEWGNLMEEILPQKRYEITIKIKDNTEREITIEYFF